MKFLKLALLSFIVFAVLITVISFFIPSQIHLSKVVEINSSDSLVMAEIGNPEKWKNWHPGIETANYNYKNGKINGFVLNKAKQQFLLLKSINTNEVVSEFALGEKTIISGWKIIPVNNNNATGVQWYMNFKLGSLPWEKFISLFYENIYGTQMQNGLDKLKLLLETNSEN